MQDSPTLIKPRTLSLWNVSKNLYLFLEPRTFAHKTVLRRKITTMATAATNPTYHLGTGRRKSSIARIRLCDGDGQITVNKRPLDEYFPQSWYAYKGTKTFDRKKVMSEWRKNKCHGYKLFI